MKTSVIYPLIPVWLFVIGCHGQTTSSSRSGIKVGGRCDGCDAMYVGMPTRLNATDTSAAWNENGVQQLLLHGTIYKSDGKTPAPDVILYYWQTDQSGYYTAKPGLNEKARRHGRLRGWVKTDAKGNYFIYTIRPAPYPGEKIPAHIHTVIREPDLGNEYYIDEFVFSDDPLVADIPRFENRGGSGILKVNKKGELQVAEHNITLGLNIPDYPKK